MTMTSRKRRALLQLLAIAPAVALPGLPNAGHAAQASLQSYPLAGNLYLITGAGGNVVLHRGSQGLTLIDSGAAEYSGALLALVEQLGGSSRIATLVNTHWHADHSGGNEAVRARGARIVAHENTRLWLGADFEVHWRNQHFTPRPAEALPDQTSYTSTILDLGDVAVECHHSEQAHTDGDFYVFFPADNVLVAGGLMTNRRYPVTDIASGGWIGGLINANKTMLQLVDDRTLIVPDSGPALRKADLQEQHDMLSTLYEKMKALTQEGFNGADMLRQGITAEFDAVWGDPEEFLLETYRGMWAHTYDMGGYI
jgi:cyclase